MIGQTNNYSKTEKFTEEITPRKQFTITFYQKKHLRIQK